MSEFIRPLRRNRPPRIGVIDFDGTLSLLRSGWVELMVGMMLEVLLPLPGTTEPQPDLVCFITDFVLNLNGRPTIFQMDYFVSAAKQRGGDPASAEYYTQTFLDALNGKSNQRIAAIQSGELAADDLLVPGARAMLSDLKSRGVQLTLASGTPVVHVQREAEILDIDHFFERRIFGPGKESREFSKLAVMKKMLTEAQADGSELLGMGDGFIEIENTKELGGIAIGCASDEVYRSGSVEDWKRSRLIQAGADVIVPDYTDWPRLSEILFSERSQ